MCRSYQSLYSCSPTPSGGLLITRYSWSGIGVLSHRGGTQLERGLGHRRWPRAERHDDLLAAADPPAPVAAHEGVDVAGDDLVLVIGGDPDDVGPRMGALTVGVELDHRGPAEVLGDVVGRQAAHHELAHGVETLDRDAVDDPHDVLRP